MWKVRHEGSPKFLEATFRQIQQGMVDGAWEPTDEVMGPADTEWVAIEAHPLLEELAAEIEPPPPRSYDEHTNLDMNAMIDVCLVLLVFFILTTTVAALQVRLEAPTVEEKNKKVKVVRQQDVEESMILCSAEVVDGEVVVKIENEPVELSRLAAALKSHVTPKKTSLLIKHGDDVPHEVVVKMIDAAKAAGMDRVNTLVP